ncbi:MAG TPA: hypothetical protein VFN11_14345 [Ktedonobacterales bacterium]|nr:hypothetical protein [Ktedonobacterales bacterium]
MTTIYIVTSGTYSDYSINGVFDSQEKAQAFIDYGLRVDLFSSYDKPHIEEWELNRHYDAISRGLTCFRVLFDNIHEGDGIARNISLIGGDDDEYTFQSKPGVTGYQTFVWTTNEASALKIGNERRVRYLLAHEHELGA